MKQIPKIDKFMTPMPHSINVEMTVNSAKEMMNKYGIRHLPVLAGGKLVGVITDRDLKLIASLSSENIKVEEAMVSDPYSVTPDSPLDAVVFEMAERKLGCAVVQQENGKVVGIFTATDGLRAFGETLQARFKG